MASFDSGEVCERSWTFYLKRPCQQIPNKQLRTVFKNTSGSQAERIRKEIKRQCKEHELKITIQINLKSVDYLEVTLNLTNGHFNAIIQKTERRAALHQHEIQPSTLCH